MGLLRGGPAGATRSKHGPCWRAAKDAPGDGLDRLLGDAYAAGMDLEVIEAAGTRGDRTAAKRKEAAAREDLAALLPRVLRIFAVRAVRLGCDRRPRRHRSQPAAGSTQAGLDLTDRESYFDDTPAVKELRAA